MKRFPALFTLALSGLLLAGCHTKAPEPDLPPATQTGANTFGCRFNGQAWIPEAVKAKQYNDILKYYYDPGYAGGNLSINTSNI